VVRKRAQRLGEPPTAEATAGVPQDIASITTIPWASRARLGNTTRSAAANNEFTSSRRLSKVTSMPWTPVQCADEAGTGTAYHQVGALLHSV
jgi:hypothetical protein